MTGTRHDPIYLSIGGQRQATCTCGWKATFGNQTWAQLQFVQHLANPATPKEQA